MSEMLQRLSEVVREKMGGNTCIQDVCRSAPCECADDIARAVIEALRKPTPDMRIQGGIAWSEALPTAETYVDTADACWKAMIDAALKG
jgi:hypothetical protein